MTVTGKKSTANRSSSGLEGVLFLAAGFGTRMEPLSLLRPKALLPFADGTVLGRLARQVAPLEPRQVAVNASRCPRLIKDELVSAFPGLEPSVHFEERPLGASATLARLSGMLSGGTWMVVNTDMVMSRPELGRMLEQHRVSDTCWTAMAGEMPVKGSYSPLSVDGDGAFGRGGSIPVHYFGVSILEPEVSAVAADVQASRGLFSELASEMLERGFRTAAFGSSSDWLDMGDIGMLRSNIGRGGAFVHPGACVAAGASLEGWNHVGRGCIIAKGTVLRDSVMLEGSSLESGELTEGLLPWFCHMDDGSPT